MNPQSHTTASFPLLEKDSGIIELARFNFPDNELPRLDRASAEIADFARDGLDGALLLPSESASEIAVMTRWRSERDYLSALHADGVPAWLRDLDERADVSRFATFAPRSVRARSGLDFSGVSPGKDQLLCLIVAETDDQAKRDGILDYNLWETDRVISSMAGFRFAAFLAGSSPFHFAELAGWESAEAYEAAFSDPRFQQHLPLSANYCEVEVSIHRAVAAASAAPPDVRKEPDR